jgi:hypothetical protein
MKKRLTLNESDMKQKINSARLIQTAIILFAVGLSMWNAFGLGSNYPNDKPVRGEGCCGWPKGMDNLVDTTNRVHGFFVNSENLFFFSGSSADFTTFLRNYSQIQGIEKHRLILHDGIGEAKSPWDKAGRSCDWKLFGCPKSWLNLAAVQKGTNSNEVFASMAKEAAKDTNYVLEVHFWTGGHIAFDRVSIPKNVEVRKDKP